MLRKTYRKLFLSAHNRVVFTVLLLEVGELLGVQDLGLTHEADAAVEQWGIVRARELFLLLEDLIQMLSDSRVGTVSANEDVTMVHGAIRASGYNIFAVLVKGNNLLAEVDVLAGNLTPK